MKKTRSLIAMLLMLAMLLVCTSSLAEMKPLGEYEDVIKLSMYLGTGTAEPQDQPNNEYVKWVLDKYKIDLSETQFLTGDPNQELGLMIASGKMPDIVCFYADNQTKQLANEFAEAGMIIEVEDLLRNNCPNLMADLNDTFIDQFRAPDGKLYMIPSGGCNPENTEANYTNEPNLTFMKRTDLFESLGLEDPKTPEDLYNVLVALSAVETANGAEFIPLQAANYAMYKELLGGMFGIYTHRKDINEEEQRFTVEEEFPEYVNFLKFMAKIYREGLVDPELFVTDDNVAISRQREARVGIGITWPNDIDVLEQAAQSTDPNARYNAFPIPKAEGVEKTDYWMSGTLPSMITLISADCADPERALAFVDWNVSKEGWIAQCYGAPVVGCWYEEDGKFFYDQAKRDEYTTADPLYENQVLGQWTYFCAYRTIYHVNHHGFENVTESPDKQRMEAREYNLPEIFVDTDWELALAIPRGEVEQLKSVAVDKVFDDGYAKIVMEAQSDEEVETMYATMMEDAVAAGLRDIEAEQYQRYQMYLNGEL